MREKGREERGYRDAGRGGEREGERGEREKEGRKREKWRETGRGERRGEGIYRCGEGWGERRGERERRRGGRERNGETGRGGEKETEGGEGERDRGVSTCRQNIGLLRMYSCVIIHPVAVFILFSKCNPDGVVIQLSGLVLVVSLGGATIATESHKTTRSVLHW